MNTNHPPFSPSEQPLTVFAQLSYEKGGFAKAKGRKTERGTGDTCCQRGGRRVKNNPSNIRMALFGKRDRNHMITC